MERFSVFLGAIVAAWLLIRAIPHLPFVNERSPAEPGNGRPTMSPAELRFYQVLLQCIPAGYEVWAKANLAEFGEYRDIHVDFLITSGADRFPALIIDFDDLTPLGIRDHAHDTIPSGLQTERIEMAGEYCAASLRCRINACLGVRQRLAA